MRRQRFFPWLNFSPPPEVNIELHHMRCISTCCMYFLAARNVEVVVVVIVLCVFKSSPKWKKKKDFWTKWQMLNEYWITMRRTKHEFGRRLKTFPSSYCCHLHLRNVQLQKKNFKIHFYKAIIVRQSKDLFQMSTIISLQKTWRNSQRNSQNRKGPNWTQWKSLAITQHPLTTPKAE